MTSKQKVLWYWLVPVILFVVFVITLSDVFLTLALIWLVVGGIVWVVRIGTGAGKLRARSQIAMIEMNERQKREAKPPEQ